jgi:hypothetical protein
MAVLRTWLLTVRDVSTSVTIANQPVIWTAMVFDAAGPILGAHVAETPEAALGDALSKALTAHPAPAVIRVDRTVPSPLVECTRTTTSHVQGPPEVEVAPLPDWTEDAVVDLALHLGRRARPTDRPTPEEWAPLHQQAGDYVRTAPWERRADDVNLRLELRIGALRSNWVAVVVGSAGVSQGLVVVPGNRVPDEDGKVTSLPGTIHFSVMGEHADQMPVGLRDRAIRYGWPKDLGMPLFLEVTEDGPTDLSRRATAVLTLALAATLDHDRRGLGHEDTIAGQMILGNGRRGRYRAWLEGNPPPNPAASLQLFSGTVRDDLLPAETVIGLGAVFWPTLATVRGAARFRLDGPRPRDQNGDGLPVLLIGLPRHAGEAVATRIKESLAEGLILMSDGAQTLIVLVGDPMFAMGSFGTREPALALFRRRLQATGGWHGIVITAEGEEPPESAIALFEFVLDQPAEPPRPPRGGRGRKRRRR